MIIKITLTGKDLISLNQNKLKRMNKFMVVDKVFIKHRLSLVGSKENKLENVEKVAHFKQMQDAEKTSINKQVKKI